MSGINNEIIVSENLVTEKFGGNDVVETGVLTSEKNQTFFKRLDDYSGYFSTQQIKSKDFSDFKNHVYFDSAVDKVSSAFQEIIEFPFDKSESEYNKYKNNLSGYTKHILQNEYPKNKGYISFRRNGYVKLRNRQGSLFNDHKDNGFGTLNPRSVAGNFSFNFWIRPINDSTNVDNDIEVVFQKIHFDSNSGFMCYLKKTVDVNDVKVQLGFKIYAGNTTFDSLIDLFTKQTNTNAEFYNICINIFKENNSSIRKIKYFVNGNPVNLVDSSSSDEISFVSFSNEFQGAENCMYISAPDNDQIVSIDNIYTLKMLSADIDEFRYYQTALSEDYIKKNMKKSIFSFRHLSLYLKFNEIGGQYTNSNVIIDHSGNKTHGLLLSQNDTSVDDTSSYFSSNDCPMLLEMIEDCPVINAGYDEIVNRRNALIDIASNYDEKNINCVFKLFPKHFFISAGSEQNLPVYANKSSYKSSNSLSAIKPANNHFVNILLIWARFFDQLKMYIDAVGTYDSINYDELNKEEVVGVHLHSLCKSYGFNFREILSTVTKDQLNNFDLLNDDQIMQSSIRSIQNKLWYRILLNSQDFLKSKGTHHSIESAFNAVGIDTSKYIDVVEQYSFNNIENIDSNIRKIKKINTLNFGHKKNILSEGIANSGIFYENKPALIKNINEIGTDFVLNNNWSIEGYFSFNDNINKISQIKKSSIYNVDSSLNYDLGNKQSLFKIANTTQDSEKIICHVRYEKHNLEGYLGNIIASFDNGSNDYVDVVIENINIYECGPFYVSIKQEYDGTLSSENVKYSLFFRQLNENITKESLSSASTRIDTTLSSFSNSSNVNLIIGQTNINGHDQPFYGEVLNIRLWNNINLSSEEIYSHSSSIDNIGLDNVNSNIEDFLKINFLPSEISNVNPVEKEIDISNVKIRYSDTDQDFYLLNNISEVLYYQKSLKFDQPNKLNRVNIISFSEQNNKVKYGNFNEFPSFNVPEGFEYDRENRISVEMSVAKKINEDIEKITSDISSFSNLLIKNQALYAKNYYSLKERREKYFEKYSQKDFLNYSSLGNVFKFFDNIMTEILDDLVSSKIINRGFNLVYESHVLERNKYHHKNGYSTIPISSKNKKHYFSKDMPESYRPAYYDNYRNRNLESTE